METLSDELTNTFGKLLDEKNPKPSAQGLKFKKEEIITLTEAVEEEEIIELTRAMELPRKAEEAKEEIEVEVEIDFYDDDDEVGPPTTPPLIAKEDPRADAYRDLEEEGLLVSMP